VSQKWGPDVEEVVAANIAACRHLRRGTLRRTIGAGLGLIGCRTESYYGCTLCKKDLSGRVLVFRVTHDPGLSWDSEIDESEFEAWLDRELGVDR
jgi:hypothetical protein